MRHDISSDTYQRSAQRLPQAKRAGSLWPFAGFIAVAAALLVLSRIGHPYALAVQSVGHEVASPLLRTASLVSEPFVGAMRRLTALRRLVEENDRLVAENRRLRANENRARDLELRVTSLEALNRTVAAAKIDFVTARVIADSGGPFVRSVIIDAGRENGIKPGHPVMSADGVAGRVVIAGQRTSRVLLTVDFNSRIPVLAGPQQARAVMEGDNSPLARISYLAPDSGAKPGDLVVTSGVGGIFPRGLHIGRIVDTGEALRIEPLVRFDRLDYLSVLLFDPPTAALAGMELNSGTGTVPFQDGPIPPARLRSGSGR